MTMGNWNPSSYKTETHLFYIVIIMNADVLGTCDARSQGISNYDIDSVELEQFGPARVNITDNGNIITNGVLYSCIFLFYNYSPDNILYYLYKINAIWSTSSTDALHLSG